MKTPTGLIAGLCVAMMSTAVLAADSHCTAAEETVFSCDLGKKVVSVCASKPLTTDSGYLQYRYGMLGKPELLFPQTSVSPKKVIQARTLMFAGGGGAYLRFNSGSTSYIVYSAIGQGWGTKDGVAVEQNGKTKTHWECKNIPTANMGEYLFTRAGLSEDTQEFELP